MHYKLEDASKPYYGQAEIVPCESKSPCASRAEILQIVFVVETTGTAAYPLFSFLASWLIVQSAICAGNVLRA